MRSLTFFFITILFAAPALAQAAPGNVAAGKVVASYACRECHDIRDQVRSPPRRVRGAAAAFVVLAEDEKLTPEKLRRYLRMPNGEKNNLLLSERETDDVIAYLLGLRR